MRPLLDDKSPQAVRIPGVPVILADNHGSLWLAHDFGGLTRITLPSKKVENYGTGLLSAISLPVVNIAAFRLASTFTAIIALALFCLGPGAYSVMHGVMAAAKSSFPHGEQASAEALHPFTSTSKVLLHPQPYVVRKKHCIS